MSHGHDADRPDFWSDWRNCRTGRGWSEPVRPGGTRPTRSEPLGTARNRSRTGRGPDRTSPVHSLPDPLRALPEGACRPCRVRSDGDGGRGYRRPVDGNGTAVTVRRDGSAAGVVLAGGSGSRLGADGNKVYLPLAGRPVLAWSLRAFAAAGIGRLVLVVRPGDEALAKRVIQDVPVHVDLVPGGTDRHGSEHNALMMLAPDIEVGAVDVVAIHDGARPLVRPELVRASLDAARRHGAAVPGVSVRDVVEVGGPGSAPRPVPGARYLVRVQTPQAFAAGPLLSAYRQAAADGFSGTDTASCVERYAGMRVHHFAGDARNLKVTFRHDLAVAEVLVGSLPEPPGPSPEQPAGQPAVSPDWRPAPDARIRPRGPEVQPRRTPGQPGYPARTRRGDQAP